MEQLSRGQEYDRNIRILLMEHMGVAMRMYVRTKEEKYLECAKEFGAQAKILSERIKTHDYSKEDAEWEYAIGLDKLAKEMTHHD